MEQKIIATVGGHQITEAEVEAFIHSLPREQQAYAASRICLLFSWKAVDECLYFCFCDLMSTNCGDYFLFHNVLLFYSTMVQLYHLYFLWSKDIWYFIYFLFFIPFMH